MPSSDVRSSETSAQNARGKNFQKFTCSSFRGFVFHGSYFRVLVVGCKNRENLDLAKISRYTVLLHVALPPPLQNNSGISLTPADEAGLATLQGESE